MLTVWATVVVIGAGFEGEQPDARIGGVAEIDVALMRQVSVEVLARVRHFQNRPDDCGSVASGALYDGAVGIRFDVFDAADERNHAIPFFGAGLGVETADFRISCPGAPQVTRTDSLFYFDVGVDLFAPEHPHFGLRALFRVDATGFAQNDAGGALFLVARF